MLRTHGGYAGWSDDALLDIPWLRFDQAARLASEAVEDLRMGDMRVAAFIGWQVGNSVSMSGKRPPSFGQYLKRLGLQERPRLSRAQIRAERARGAANVERARAAFAEGGARKAFSG